VSGVQAITAAAVASRICEPSRIAGAGQAGQAVEFAMGNETSRY